MIEKLTNRCEHVSMDKINEIIDQVNKNTKEIKRIKKFSHSHIRSLALRKEEE